MWPEFLKNYFGLNRQQRNGIMVLIALCGLLFLVQLILPLFDQKEELLIKNLPLIYRKTDSSVQATNLETPLINTPTRLFPFNPNLVNFDEMIELGFSDWSAKALINYRKKGFVFKKKSDLLKVYGIPEGLYQQLEAWIQLDSQISTQNSAYPKALNPAGPVGEQGKKMKLLELNSADSLKLLEINGIGPTFAHRIIKYRSLLGGYINREQLLEVYGMKPEVYEKIKMQIEVNASLVRKLKLNYEDFKTINRHPYFSYEFTKSIMNARRSAKLNLGMFQELVSDTVDLGRLLPYCDFD